MNASEQKAVLTLCLLAASADGVTEDSEKDQLRQLVAAFEASQADLADIYRDILLNSMTMDSAAAALQSDDVRQEAYKLAAGICDADGARSEQETAFLEKLRTALGIRGENTLPAVAEIQKLGFESLASQGQPPPSASSVDMDGMIRKYAILTAALEMLPQAISGLAILPMQMKLVYNIGKAHGFELGRHHIRDFAATIGISFAGQMVEQVGRRLLGGLLGKIGGRIGRGIGSASAGAAVTFATTYALGRVAVRYYGSGRSISVAELKQTFGELLEEGKALFPRYAAEAEQQASTLEAEGVSNLAKGF